MSLQLLSIILQFLAAFMLSVEAIGIKRVRRWIALLSFVNFRFAFPFGLFVVGFPVGQYFELHPPSMLPPDLFPSFSSLVGFVITMMVALAFVCLTIVSLKFIEFIDSHIRANSAGVVGFVLLTLGFGVQFVVILYQEASK